MASAMVRPMPLDGQYALAQVWKLDSYKGRTIPLSTMLAEYLMLPAFPSARFKAWAEQYDRLPATTVISQVQLYLLPHEEFPQQIDDDSLVLCSGLRIVGGVRTWIDYHGTLAQYLSQREAIFGTTTPTSMMITVRLTHEELHYLSDWDDRYVCPWPLVDGMWRPGYHARAPIPRRHRTVHPHLSALYERQRAFWTQREATAEMEPLYGDHNYVAVRYYEGELHSRTVHIREPDPLEGLFVDVEEEILRPRPPTPPQLRPLQWYPRPTDGETDVPDDAADVANDSPDEWD